VAGATHNQRIGGATPTQHDHVREEEAQAKEADRNRKGGPNQGRGIFFSLRFSLWNETRLLAFTTGARRL
jgi:hypothetical protein